MCVCVCVYNQRLCIRTVFRLNGRKIITPRPFRYNVRRAFLPDFVAALREVGEVYSPVPTIVITIQSTAVTVVSVQTKRTSTRPLPVRYLRLYNRGLSPKERTSLFGRIELKMCVSKSIRIFSCYSKDVTLFSAINEMQWDYVANVIRSNSETANVNLALLSYTIMSLFAKAQIIKSLSEFLIFAK